MRSYSFFSQALNDAQALALSKGLIKTLQGDESGDDEEEISHIPKPSIVETGRDVQPTQDASKYPSMTIFLAMGSFTMISHSLASCTASPSSTGGERRHTFAFSPW